MPKSPRDSGKYRHWCFTINNPTADDNISKEKFEHISYLIAGKEVGEDGTPHLQGYVCFINRKRLTTVKKFFPRAHLEVKKGTVKQALTYCKKDGDWEEWGVVPVTQKEATQNRWDNARKLAEEGNFEEIPSDMWIRYLHSFMRIRQEKQRPPPKLKAKHNVWIVAPSGHGKSTYAWEEYPEAYDKMPNKWWLAYHNEDTIILDDWGPEQCKYMAYYMKRWADVFPFMAETKGGGRFIRPKKFVVTSQYMIEECFDDPKVVEAIQNRFDVLALEHWRRRSKHFSNVFKKQL